MVDAWEGAVANQVGDNLQGLFGKRRLNIKQWVRMIRLANPNTIPGQSTEIVFIHSDIDIGVIEIVERQIPIA